MFTEAIRVDHHVIMCVYGPHHLRHPLVLIVLPNSSIKPVTENQKV